MSSYEEFIFNLLKKEKVSFEREKTFKDLKKGLFRYDFFIEYNKKKIIIEIDGEYHFRPIRGRQILMKQQEYDRRKNSYCLANSIPLYRIPYWEISKIKNVKDLFQDKFLVKTKWHNDMLIAPKS